GQTTRDAARMAASGSTLGVDLSARMIELARRLAADEHLANVRFEQADVQICPFGDASFDGAISRTGTMFFADPLAAFTNIAEGLRGGGGLTMLVWQGLERNEWIRELGAALAAGRELRLPPAGVQGPFALADPEHVRELLTCAGFADVRAVGTQQPMWFGADADDAHGFVLGLMGWMLEGLDDEGRDRALGSLRTTLGAHESGAGVLFGSGAWTIRATRA